MKRIGFALALALGGCVSLTADGSKVKVYQAELANKDAAVPPVPTGCKLLGQSGPIDQEQQAFEISDPYRTERNNTAALGGNVLYVPFYRFKNLMKTDCPIGDKTPGCMDSDQSWYKVTFRSYACDAPALQALAESPVPTQPAVFRVEFKKKPTPEPTPAVASAAPAPPPSAAAPSAASAATIPVAPPSLPSPGADALKTQILDLMREGIGTDVIRSFVRAHPLSTPLSAAEIIDWKKAGIPDSVIDATFPK
jgi:hypothetical protein